MWRNTNRGWGQVHFLQIWIGRGLGGFATFAVDDQNLLYQ